MQRKTSNFAGEIRKYVNENFLADNYRFKFLKNFDDWPSPRSETWRLSRLGKLARKNIKPISPNRSKEINFSKFVNDSYSLVFENGFLFKQEVR